jgi:hypothetical protein
MSRHIIGTAAFSGAVVVALVFGARSAVAAPAGLERAALICLKSVDCRSYCRTYYPFSIPLCTAGHCECVFP